MKTSLFLSVVAFLMWAGCSLFDTGGSADDPGDPEAQIIFGESIEGIKIGDDAMSVIEILGAPTETSPADLDGDILLYRDGDFAGMDVVISRDPALGLGVVWVQLIAPYRGETKGSAGIGTPRGEVLAELGPPDTVDASGRYATYLFEANAFEVEYRDETIFLIIMRVPNRN